VSIEIPNTHPIYDPEWAKARVQEKYADAITLGREITLFGADLLRRALASAPDDRGHRILLTVLVRQLLAAFDAAVLSLQGASEHALVVQSRLVIESRWALILGLRDPAKWGRHVYVASRRHQKRLLRRAIPETAEYIKYEAARDLIGEAAAALPAGGLAEQLEHVDTIDAILAAPDLVHINALFEEWLSSKRYEAYWFYDGPSPSSARLKSYFDLAKEVGCEGEYISMYSWTSLSVHGGYTSSHLLHSKQRVAIAPLRTPGGLRHSYLLAATMTAECYKRIIETYRNGELPQFLHQHLTEWRERLRAMPEIELTLGPEDE
jgi:hypothetical protein